MEPTNTYNKLLQIYNPTLKSIVSYGTEKFKFNKNLESELVMMEMDFLRRLARSSRLEKNKNNVLGEKCKEPEIRGCR